MLAQKNDFLTVILSSFDSSWITMTSCPHPLQNVNKRTIAIPSSIYFATNYADEQSISHVYVPNIQRTAKVSIFDQLWLWISVP